jgi:hypothetical protein
MVGQVDGFEVGRESEPLVLDGLLDAKVERTEAGKSLAVWGPKTGS